VVSILQGFANLLQPQIESLQLIANRFTAWDQLSSSSKNVDVSGQDADIHEVKMNIQVGGMNIFLEGSSASGSVVSLEHVDFQFIYSHLVTFFPTISLYLISIYKSIGINTY
jgi:hypothetical protein